MNFLLRELKLVFYRSGAQINVRSGMKISQNTQKLYKMNYNRAISNKL